MILASWNAIPKNIEQVDFLKGPAKVYDGAFDRDNLTFPEILFADRPFSVLAAVYIDKPTVRILDYDSLAASGFGFSFGTQDGRVIAFLNNSIAPDACVVRANTSVNQGKYIIGISYDGSKDSSGLKLFLNGAELTSRTVLKNNLNSLNFGGGASQIGGFRNYQPTVFDLKSAMKQLEIINRVATPAEMATAGNPVTGGSFRASGIAHNSGQYQLAVDFNQTDGNPPTTFPNTPQYSITSLGGAEYVNYEDL